LALRLLDGRVDECAGVLHALPRRVRRLLCFGELIPRLVESLVFDARLAEQLVRFGLELARVFGLAVNASGAVSIKTIPLISAEEMDAAAKKQIAYRPPGAS